MTETETTELPTPWPIPQGTRLPEEVLGLLVDMEAGSAVVANAFMDLTKGAPVKAREEDHAVYLHDLAVLIDGIEKIVDSLRETREEVAATFARELPYQTSLVAYGDLRPMKPRFPKDRKGWDNEALQADVLPALTADIPDNLVDPETGTPHRPREIVDRVLSVVSLTGSNVKTTGIKALGLDPDDYCHASKADPTVQVVK